MATDRRLAYADIDQELFDVDQIPMTTRDVRSIGEMLFDVDHLARQLLMDVGGDDAGTLLRSWPTMVAAAEDLWASLPGGRPGVDERDRPITSLSAQAATIESSLTGRKAWPGQGPTNPRVDQMTQTLLNAAALVRRYGAAIPHEQTEAHRDLEAARTRIMHGLYLTAHAVNVALHDNGRDRVTDARESGRRVQLAQHHSPYAVAPTGVWVDRMSACENTARSYLTNRFPHALTGEAIRPVDDPGRLAQALADWDIQSHRALARQLEPSNILLITRTQGLIAGASMVLVDAAATAGILEPSDRLVPAIADAGHSWSNLASRWGDLAPPGARLEEPLARAAAEVRAAYRQITHDTTTLATPEVIATRPGLPQATAATLRAIEAGSELAHVVAEKADTPNLTGPARALSRRAHNDVESGCVAAPPEGDVVWISPADILARRWVPIPRPVATALRAASATAAMTTEVASRAASVHLPPSCVREILRDQRGSESQERTGWQPVGSAEPGSLRL
ncbi:hypothetical protein [Nocardioides daphniae]|uniref:Uncharacterized protein n=1 Tax=Nocardioides daphniae TaxID=402297 RepID=A0A4P7U8X7_9ACTN|nr:hypothetical protein [Nocardioides daphniae]QCC76084.1 hypothetical protein E2C04_00715 [Nocardioides daphniae]GGD10356.1 hypothetical protein GCM10007231_06440 [Nocardioides daphniae]